MKLEPGGILTNLNCLVAESQYRIESATRRTRKETKRAISFTLSPRIFIPGGSIPWFAKTWHLTKIAGKAPFHKCGPFLSREEELINATSAHSCKRALSKVRATELST